MKIRLRTFFLGVLLTTVSLNSFAFKFAGENNWRTYHKVKSDFLETVGVKARLERDSERCVLLEGEPLYPNNWSEDGLCYPALKVVFTSVGNTSGRHLEFSEVSVYENFEPYRVLVLVENPLPSVNGSVVYRIFAKSKLVLTLAFLSENGADVYTVEFLNDEAGLTLRGNHQP